MPSVRGALNPDSGAFWDRFIDQVKRSDKDFVLQDLRDVHIRHHIQPATLLLAVSEALICAASRAKPPTNKMGGWLHLGMHQMAPERRSAFRGSGVVVQRSRGPAVPRGDAMLRPYVLGARCVSISGDQSQLINWWATSWKVAHRSPVGHRLARRRSQRNRRAVASRRTLLHAV